MKKGWPTKRISEIAKHSLGKMLDKAKNRGEPKPYLRNLNVRWGEFDLSDLLEMRFLLEEAEKYTAVKGDVLICEGGYPGRAAIWDQDEPIYFQKALHRVRFHEPERNKWFVYYLQFRDLEGTLRNHFNGAGIQHFTGEALAQFEIPVPPLPEQQRIVGILEEAFGGLATAQAHASQNLQNARDLFESHLQSVFTQRGKGWVERTLGEVAEVQSGGTPLVSQKAFWNGTIPWYSSGELNALITTTPNRNITKAGLENSNAKVFPKGSLLIGMYDTAALKMSILDREGAFNQAVAGVKPNQNIELAFILYAINAVKPTLLLQRRGVRQKNLSLAKIKDIAVPMPTPSEQRATVERLRGVSEETQRLESIYQRKLAALDELKKSLLHQAFSGEL